MMRKLLLACLLMTISHISLSQVIPSHLKTRRVDADTVSVRKSGSIKGRSYSDGTDYIHQAVGGLNLFSGGDIGFASGYFVRLPRVALSSVPAGLAGVSRLMYVTNPLNAGDYVQFYSPELGSRRAVLHINAQIAQPGDGYFTFKSDGDTVAIVTAVPEADVTGLTASLASKALKTTEITLQSSSADMVLINGGLSAPYDLSQDAVITFATPQAIGITSSPQFKNGSWIADGDTMRNSVATGKQLADWRVNSARMFSVDTTGKQQVRETEYISKTQPGLQLNNLTPAQIADMGAEFAGGEQVYETNGNGPASRMLASRNGINEEYVFQSQLPGHNYGEEGALVKIAAVGDSTDYVPKPSTNGPGKYAINLKADSLGFPKWRVPSTGSGWFDDFISNTANGNTGWSNAVNGASAGGSADNTNIVLGSQRTLGVLRNATGTDAAGRSCLHKGSSQWIFGGGTVMWEARILMDDLSVDAADEFVTYMGFLDAVNAGGASGADNQADGVYFRYNVDSSANWQCVVANNSTRPRVTTTTAVTTDTWVRLGIFVNAAGTQARFYINGTLVATISSSNIPTADGRETGVGMKIEKIAGTNARQFDIDYVWVEADLTR